MNSLLDYFRQWFTMDLKRCKSLNELMSNLDFQNIVQGVHALNSARTSFCDLIEKQWRQFIATLPTTEKEHLGTFIRCVNQHGIKLDYANINNEDLGCGHENCELLYTRLRRFAYVTGDISAEQNRESVFQELHHSFSITDSCFSFTWDLAYCFIGVKTQDVKLHGREMNAKTVIKLMKNCRMFAFKDSEKIYGQVLEDIDKLIYAKDLLISKKDREMLFDHLLVLLMRWQNNCQSCSYGVEDIKKMQHAHADCDIFLVKNVLESIKSMLDDSESDCVLPANIKSKDVSSSKELISSLLLQMEEMISAKEAYEQNDSLEEDPKTLKTETDIEISKEEAKMNKTKELEDKMKELAADNERHKTSLAHVMIEVSEIKEENKKLEEKYLKLQVEIYQMRCFKDEEIRKYKELQLKLKTLETDLERKGVMDNNQKQHSDKRAGMDFKTKMKLFQSNDNDKQAPEPSQKETMSPESRHSQQNSEAPVVKAYSPCKEEENTNRTLPSPEPPTEQTSKTLRISSSPESAKGTDEETVTTNELKISSSPESPKGTAGETITTNESRLQETKFDKELQEQVKEISSGKGRGWNPKDLEVFNHPMCLISAESIENEDGEEDKIMLKSEEEVFEQIKQIDLPLVVVAVVGLYRTGKSYLMNCLAESSKGGFALGNTIQSETKGIWVWCKMHPQQKNTVLVLLDTEGLGDVEKGDQNHDNNIFTLATLLCNCLVYNMKGAFDNEALSKLTFVTEMAKNIRYRGQSSEDNQMLNLILPDFVLCVRDFTLKLEFDGKGISANEYLEKSLASKKGKAAKFNKPRECIRKYFPKRECFAFPMPGDTSVIRNLKNMSFDDLCSSFREATITFVSFIYDIPPKEISASKPINGEMFVTLADRYVTAIKHGAVPDVDDAFKAAAKIENAKIEKQAVEIFENQMVKVALPVPGNVLRGLYSKAQQTTLEYLRQNAVHDLKIECENHAQRRMDELWNAIKEDNDTKVQEICERTLQDNAYRRGIEEKIGNNNYKTAGGYRKFQRDVERLKEEYISVLRDFDEDKILWTWHGFIKSIKESEAGIVEADEHLSKLEKEEEQRRNQENIEKIMKEQQKAQQEALDKQEKDLADHYKKLDEAREKQLKEDQAKYEEFAEKRLEKEAAKKEIKRYQDEQTERKNKWFGARMWNVFWNDD